MEALYFADLLRNNIHNKKKQLLVELTLCQGLHILSYPPHRTVVKSEEAHVYEVLSAVPGI